MSKEWISDENWDSVVIERKERKKKKKIGERKRQASVMLVPLLSFLKKIFILFIYFFVLNACGILVP